jgi:uncharacterized membrane protein YccC
MRFKPIKQFNAILTQEYFEPTLSWAFRVVLALNVPLIFLPLITGFSFNVIWAAFGAYIISLTDYRGLHYKKIVIQGIESILIFLCAMLGMLTSGSLVFSLTAMFFVGMFAALVRNWRDYGANIGVAVGFFFLFGLSDPQPFEQALESGMYLVLGAGWAIVITVFSFPLRPSNPVKRSVAKIWKENTELLDTIIDQLSAENSSSREITKKEILVRSAINQSIELFARRSRDPKSKVQHYDILIELRRLAALFSATLGSLYEEIGVIHKITNNKVNESAVYKTLSSLAQASARLSIVVYTSRPEDFTVAKVRVKRYEIAIELFKEFALKMDGTAQEQQSLKHFIDSLDKAYSYLYESITRLEEKINLKRGDYFESYRLSFDNFIAGVNNWVFLDLIKNVFRFNSDQFKYAVRVSIGLTIAVFIFKFFHIDHGYWIALTMIIVIQPYYGATRKKGLERITGTVAGVILGGLIMLLPLKHDVFVILLVFVSFFVAYFLRNNYKVGVFFVTIMMVILMQLSQQGSLELIGWRIISTLIGAALAIISGYSFWPVWEKQRFPVLMVKALEENKNYLKRVVYYYKKELQPHETWFANRRLTEEANNLVFASVQRMYEEPKRLQDQVDLYFSMVGISIRITREITSIALIANTAFEKENSNPLSKYIEEIEPIFEKLILIVSGEQKLIEPIDYAPIKQSLEEISFHGEQESLFVKVELEKIIFELETLSKLVRK